MGWLRGWRLLALSVVALLLTAVGAFLIWLHSDADLRAVEAEAAALGVPTRWEQLGRAVSAPDRVAIWNRVVALRARLAVFEPGIQGRPRLPKPGQPVPEEMRRHYASLDVADLKALDSVLDALGGEVLIQHAEYRLSTKTPHIFEYRKLINLQRDQVMLAEPESVVSMSVRALDAAATLEPAPLIGYLVRVACDQMIAGAIVFRLRDIPDDDRSVLAARLARAVDEGPRLLRTAIQTEWLYMFGAMREPPRSIGVILGGDEWPAMAASFVGRAGRSGALHIPLHWSRFVSGEPTMPQLVAEAARIDAMVDAESGWLPSTPMRRSLETGFASLIRFHANRHMQLAVLAAELSGSTWPDDAYAAGPLRRIERDGRLIAAYSVGSDGVDDGGDRKKDRIIELYGTLAPDSAAPTTAPARSAVPGGDTP